jgi:hypothetical protein
VVERIAPSVNGTGGYDGQPGNQSSSKHNPSGSANPEKQPGHWGKGKYNSTERRWDKMKDQLWLEVEELEERIAPGGLGPSNNGNPGNEVSNGSKPHPSGGNGNWWIDWWTEHQEIFDFRWANCQLTVLFRTRRLLTPGSVRSRSWRGRMNRTPPAGSCVLIPKAGKKNNKHKNLWKIKSNLALKSSRNE